MKKFPHNRQRTLRALAPTRAHRDTVVVEANPRTRYQLRLHQNKPAIGVVLGRTRLASHVRTNAEPAANTGARTLVDHTTHHVQQCLRDRGLHHCFSRMRCKLLQYLAIAVFNLRHQKRLYVAAIIGQRAVA